MLLQIIITVDTSDQTVVLTIDQDGAEIYRRECQTVTEALARLGLTIERVVAGKLQPPT